MKEKTIQLLQISLEDFGNFIKETVSNEISKLGNLCVKKQETNSEELLTRDEACEMLGVSYTTLYHWNKDLTLPARKMGRRVYYVKQDVFDKLKLVA